MNEECPMVGTLVLSKDCDIDLTDHRQPILSAKKPPRGAPTADPVANTMFIIPVHTGKSLLFMFKNVCKPCQVPLDRNGTISDMMILTTL